MSAAQPIAAPWAVATLRHGLGPLARYHRYRAQGLEHVPAQGPVLVAVNHSFATYDGFLLARAIYEASGRVGVGLGDHQLFRVPGLKKLAWQAGIRPGLPAQGAQLFREGHLVYVAPGGMWEAVRPHTQRGQIRWQQRRGFARLCVLTGTPLVLAACPAADDLYRVHAGRLTDYVYRHYKLPLVLPRGRWSGPLPKPVALTHYLSAPLQPPPYRVERFEQDVEAFHALAVRTMRALLACER